MKLVQTCAACPEQYELRTQEGTVIGRLKFRYGRFRAWHEGRIVHLSILGGVDGVFSQEERAEQLPLGVAEILRAEGSVAERNIPGLAKTLSAAFIRVDPGDDF